jgi:hypothetical protein
VAQQSPQGRAMTADADVVLPAPAKKARIGFLPWRRA